MVEILKQWTQDERDRLQSMVEVAQRNWISQDPKDAKAGGASFIPPCTSETPLAAFAEELIVSPPPGLEVGYVPICLAQRAA